MKIATALRSRNPLLYYVGLAHLVGAGACLLLIMIDDTQILGIDRWIKPFKFYSSSAVYLLTFGWLTGDLPRGSFIRNFSRQISLAIIVENVIITAQAARGVKSHFNFESWSGGIAFAVMGVFILYNTIWVFLFSIRYFWANLKELPAPYTLGVRLGLVLFLLGSTIGGYMSGQPGHTVGASDGGSGLPLLNWSTGFGDLRVSHFFGLHGLQILMLLGIFVTPNRLSAGIRKGIVWFTFGSMVCFIIWTFWEAIHEIPLLKI